ncbi:MAG: hypothetical protein K0M56_05285 [Kaistella sp.]|nr:hypothetical protein [Kaistella sp.]
MGKKLFIFFFVLVNIFSYSQNISEKGSPYIKNYLPKDYGNHGKIWAISSARNGLVYMASDNGLLEFDGKKWLRFRAYSGSTRSLFLRNDNSISIGADMDFGLWEKDKLRKFTYQSLYPFKNTATAGNEEFWGTYALLNKQIFVSHQNIYSISNRKITKIAAPYEFSRSFELDGTVYLADAKKGFYRLKETSLELIFKFPNESPLKIAGVFKIQENLYIVTENKGIFHFSQGKLSPFSTPVNSEVAKHRVFSFTTINKKYLAFGTILNGLYITDLKGNIIQHINKEKGLLNNTVLSMHFQKNGKLWLGLDHGISVINVGDEVTYFNEDQSNIGTANTAVLNDNVFLIGTNQGLYTANWNELNNKNSHKQLFQLIPGSEGQVWTLKKTENRILCGHDTGLYEIKGSSFTQISNRPGIMCLLQNGNFLFAGNYSGIAVFEKKGDEWVFLKKMKSILGAVSQLVQENDTTFWANLPNYGILRFTLNQNLEPENRKIFFSKKFSGYFPHLYKSDQGIQLKTSTAQYHFRRKKKDFVREIVSEPNSIINNVINGFYRPIMLNENFGFYGIDNGFALENFASTEKAVRFSSALQIRDASAFNNDKTKPLFVNEKLPYRLNNIRISYILPNEDGVQYQYFLENFSQQWSSWSKETDVDFVNLHEGEYALKVRAKKDSEISELSEFPFTILPPWYRSIWSYALYLMIVAVLFYVLRKNQQNKLRLQKMKLLKKERASLRKQAERHRQELMWQEHKILEEEKELLKNQVKNKTIELAKKAKEDDDKSRLLHSLKDKISEAETNPVISNIKWKEMRKLLDCYLEIEDDTFEIQMDELHQEFFKSLKERFPQLSIYDLRLCAYLKIGLHSKEMADILHVLPSSINVSRSRLRKKLNLRPDEDLFEFLNKF